MTLANAVTLARIALAPAPALLIEPYGAWVALTAFSVLAASDALDGFLARRFDQCSALGRALDPIADKALLLSGLIAVAETAQGESVWFAAAAALIVVREAVIAGLRVAASGADPLPVSPAAKWKTAVQMVAVGALLAPLESVGPIGMALLWVAVALSWATAVGYGRRLRNATFWEAR